MPNQRVMIRSTYLAVALALLHPASGVAAAQNQAGRGSTGQKSQIAVADLVGRWEHTSSSYADYVSSTGGHAGSSIVAYGEAYTFAADGTFTFGLTGITGGRYVKESDSGAWGFQAGNLVIRGKQRPQKTYQIVGYEMATDGTVFMTLLDAVYPRTQGNIQLYGERYVRKGK